MPPFADVLQWEHLPQANLPDGRDRDGADAYAARNVVLDKHGS